MVIVTRGHSQDAVALRACIASETAYIGMIGSANKIGIMREKFLDEGWASEAQWERIHAPIGLEIQSKTVQEIAVSIAGQLILVRNKVQNQLRRTK
jgi:xanthine dehydrogenase accessory factor